MRTDCASLTGRQVEDHLAAIVNTYRRPAVLWESLVAVAGQTRPPELLIIVDNDGTEDLTTRLSSHPIHSVCNVRILTPGRNLGPAGGFALGMDELAAHLPAAIHLLCLDDDDPPGRRDLVESLLKILRNAPPDVAGVGLRGGTLDTRTGLIRGHQLGIGLQEVDHLHGGYVPIYRLDALRAAGGFDPQLFWGFEELDIGRRLRGRGFRLLADTDLLASVEDRYPKIARRSAPHRLAEPSWRHYYRHRNLLHVLRRDRGWSGAVLTILARLILKPLLLCPTDPRRALWHLRTNVGAICDGFSGDKLGTRHAPAPAPPSVVSA